MEGRTFAKRNSRPQSTSRTLSRNHDESPEWERVRQRAKREKGAVFSALFHHLDVDRLRESYGRLKPKSAAGVDGIRWQDYVVRYADDFVTSFEFQDDAERFLAALKERLAKFALELHGDKTRLLEFGRFAAERRGKRGEGKPKTFNFLGFVHICGMTKQGWFRVLRRTVPKRQTAKLKELGEEMKVRRHQSIKEQGAWLGTVLRGYYGYYAVPGNSKALANFRWELSRRWYRSLCRRSHKKRLNWSKMQLHISRWLPSPRIVHPYPEERFKGKSPVR